MKTTFNDSELKRILKEFAAVNANQIALARTTSGAVKKQNACVNRFAAKINGWVHSKIESNYKAKIVKQ
jgi:hypothetical protein